MRIIQDGTAKTDPSVNELMDILYFHFNKIIDIFEEYPNCFGISKGGERGYYVSIDLDSLELHREEAILNP